MFVFFKKITGLLHRRQSTVLTAAMIIMFSYGMSMLLGVLRDRLLVTFFYGCCKSQLDVYYAAFRLPDTLFQLLVSGSLTAAFIPTFSKLLDRSEEKAYEVASVVLNGLLVGFVILAIPILIWAPQLSELITGSFSPDQINLMTNFTRMMLLAQLFFLFSSFMTGMIQSNHRFLLPALAPVAYNSAIIGGIVLLSGKYGIYAPVLGVMVGAALHASLQIPLIWKLGFRYRWNWNFKLKEVREMGKLMLPRTISSGVSQFEATAAVFFATSLASGSLVFFSLAQTLMLLPIKLVGIPISQAAFPQLASLSDKNISKFRQVITENFLQILYFVLPLTSILLVLRIPIVRLAYGAANFPWHATLETGRTLALFVIAIPAQAVVQLLVRSFYAQKDTRTPLLSAIVGMLLFLLFSSWFTFDLGWGIKGLAVSTSIASFVQMSLLLGFLNQDTKFITQGMVFPAIKLLFTTLLTATFLWVPMRLLDQLVFDTTRVLPLIGLTVTATAMGLAVYLSLCFWLQVKEQETFFNLIHKLPAMRKSVAKLRTLVSISAEPTVGIGDGKV